MEKSVYKSLVAILVDYQKKHPENSENLDTITYA